MVGRHDGARLEDVAARLRNVNADASLEITVECRWRGLFVVEGLAVSDLWTDVFEPIRSRPLWSRRWRSRRSLADAEQAVLSFLNERPDLRDLEQ